MGHHNASRIRQSGSHSIGLAIYLLLPLLCSQSFAGLPVSIRLIEGASQVTQTSAEFDTHRLSLTTGAGIAYEISPRHAVSIDVESMERRANQSDLIGGIPQAQEAPYSHLRYTLVTLGYRLTLNPHACFYTVSLIGGFGIGSIRQYDEYMRHHGSVPPEQVGSGDLTYKGDSHWKSGIVLGIGSAVRVERNMRMGAVVQYRHLHYQSYHMLPLGSEPPPESSLPVLKGGLEAKLIFEFRL